MEHAIQDALSQAFRQVSRVECVYAIPQGETLSVYTIIDNEDEEAYDLIYNQERVLIQNHEGANFDFNVIARHGRSIGDIMGDIAPIWRRSESEAADLCLAKQNT